MTVAHWRKWATEQLREAGVDEPERESTYLAALALGVDRSWILAHPEAPVPMDVARELLVRRCRHEPMAYIKGEREFYGRMFRVGPGALIPRPETEALIERALAVGLPEEAEVLDLGTGSGCIAVTLALERPAWRVTAVDISAKALRWATENVARYAVEVSLQQSDLAQGLVGRLFDLVVSNPPYVALTDPLPTEVRDWEPASALFAGEFGLSLYARMARELALGIKPGGSLLLEHGATQRAAISDLFHAQGWQTRASWVDLAGLPRGLHFSPPVDIPISRANRP